jgi:hypothetical protein
MWISEAFAAHGVVGTGSSGGGNALLIILGVAILLGAVYVLQKRLRKRLAERKESDR